MRSHRWSALGDAGFEQLGKRGVGVWKARRLDRSGGEVEVLVDLLVPSTVSPGAGRRAAKLPGHDDHAARKVDGLEGALVDQVELEICSLEPDDDPRQIRARIAGPGALIAAKLFKISERAGTPRANDKDALDVLRLLQNIPTEALAVRFALMRRDTRSRAIAERAQALLDELFGSQEREGGGHGRTRGMAADGPGSGSLVLRVARR